MHGSKPNQCDQCGKKRVRGYCVGTCGYVPSEGDIRKAADKIRSKWSEAESQRRETGPGAVPVDVRLHGNGDQLHNGNPFLDGDMEP